MVGIKGAKKQQPMTECEHCFCLLQCARHYCTDCGEITKSGRRALARMDRRINALEAMFEAQNNAAKKGRSNEKE